MSSKVFPNADIIEQSLIKSKGIMTELQSYVNNNKVTSFKSKEEFIINPSTVSFEKITLQESVTISIKMNTIMHIEIFIHVKTPVTKMNTQPEP